MTMTLEQRQEAASDVTATLMDWFPSLTGEECERIAKLAVAACDRAVDIEQPRREVCCHESWCSCPACALIDGGES